MNGISHRLHSSKLDLFGLAAAAGTFCKEVSSRSGVIVEFTHEDLPTTLPPDIAINLFRVLQEALSNAVKHSGESRFDVSLRGTNRQLQLAVRDERARGSTPKPPWRRLVSAWSACRNGSNW